MAKLQGNEEPKKGSGLEYMYLDVKDDYRDGKHITPCHTSTFTSFPTVSSQGKYAFNLLFRKKKILYNICLAFCYIRRSLTTFLLASLIVKLL